MKKFKVLAAALALSFVLGACSPSGKTQDGQEENASANSSSDTSDSGDMPLTITGKRGTQLSAASDGNLSIVRLENGTNSDTPTDEIWTVFVYLCGTDLESNYGCATNDLNEMIGASKESANLRFVVEAGGTNTWQNDYCANGKNTRLIISGGNVTTLESETADMGDPLTLALFVDWGLTNFVSQYNMLVFWDHGGGSISGVCFDERYSYDSLSLTEIDIALAALYDKYALKFNLIGCDACLMATVEMANIFASYADYMIASQEVEPGSGWAYAGIANGVNAGASDGSMLGKYICDEYYNSLKGSTCLDTATLSVIDLSAIDDFLLGFNSYCIDIYDYICNQNGIDQIMKVSRNLPSFGEGYNLTDLGLFIEKTSAYSANANSALSLMNKCVVYMVNGNAYKDVGGIAVYFPIDTPSGSIHVNSLKSLCVTPYYMGIVDVCAYGKDSAGDISGYDADQWTGSDSEYWSDNNVDESNYDYWEDETAGTMNTNEANSGISFSEAPYHKDPLIGFDKYAFTFSTEGLKNVDMVYTNLFAVTDEDSQTLMIDLGVQLVGNGDYYRANNIRTIEEQFYGMGVGLSNGNLCSVHPLTRRYVDGYGYVSFYYTPVEINGEFKNLIFYGYYKKLNDSWLPAAPQYIAIGTTEIGSETSASRVEPLKKGDSIIAICPTYDADTMEFLHYSYANNRNPYVCQADGDFNLNWNIEMPNGYYAWMFMIDDIYGNTLYTNPVICQVDTSGLWPYSIIG